MNPSHSEQSGIIQLSDPRHITNQIIYIGCYIGSAFMMYVAFSIFIFKSFEFFSFIFLAALSVGIGIAGRFFQKISAVSEKGFILDFNEGTFEFCAFKEGNNIFETYSSEYLKTALERTTIKFSDIKQLTQKTVESKDKEGKYSYQYFLSIQGDFGAYEFGFSNENKRAELAAHLTQAAQLGHPVVVR